MTQRIKQLVGSRFHGPYRATSAPVSALKTGPQVKTEHITDESLRGYIEGVVELTDREQEHMLGCSFCDERFRLFLTSNGESKAS